jgi:hypothetical protein
LLEPSSQSSQKKDGVGARFLIVRLFLKLSKRLDYKAPGCVRIHCLFPYLRLGFVGLGVKGYRRETFANAVDLIPLIRAAAAERLFLAFNADGGDVVGIE